MADSELSAPRAPALAAQKGRKASPLGPWELLVRI